jgi:hypothetical protein
MADPDYNEIPNANITIDKPLTEGLATGFRDNPIAMVRGADGAPRLDGRAAVLPTLVGDEVSSLTVVAADTFTVGVGVDSTTGANTTNSTSFVEAFSNTILTFNGTMRFKASHRATGGVTSTLQVSKNGVAVNSWTTTSATAIERTQDIAIVEDDVISWEHKISIVTETSTVSGETMTASNNYYRLGVITQGFYT